MDDGSKRILKCSNCRSPIEREGNCHFPFCSDHCRLIDLSKWLNEEYSVPVLMTERDVDLVQEAIKGRTEH